MCTWIIQIPYSLLFVVTWLVSPVWKSCVGHWLTIKVQTFIWLNVVIMILYGTCYFIILYDTLYFMIHYSLWYFMIHDTLWYFMILYDAAYTLFFYISDMALVIQWCRLIFYLAAQMLSWKWAMRRWQYIKTAVSHGFHSRYSIVPVQ